MRKTYKFSSSIAQGGFLYVHKTANNRKIEDKKGLKKMLNDISEKFKLIDVTIKIYDSIFFFFFMVKPTIAPITIINSIQESIDPLDSWDDGYVFTGVYDLQEEYVRKDLKKWGFDYDKG